jgi:hypothetical protein
MKKKLTITVDEEIYEGLRQVIGPRRISRFIEDLVRPYLLHPDLEAGYKAMAEDEAREAEALEWAEALIGEVAHETR